MAIYNKNQATVSQNHTKIQPLVTCMYICVELRTSHVPSLSHFFQFCSTLELLFSSNWLKSLDINP